ncbi:MAG TPA: hypothetical protein DCZ55_03670 [Cyanobacteria bacterium UBA11371]|nr:hypothetical protein [Cyanobacteria bacterium UBA11371]
MDRRSLWLNLVGTGWRGKGYALNQLKQYEAAIASYDKAIKLDPNHQTAIDNRKAISSGST